MISAWNLCWIVPAASCFGFAICAMLKVGSAADDCLGLDDYDDHVFYTK